MCAKLYICAFEKQGFCECCWFYRKPEAMLLRSLNFLSETGQLVQALSSASSGQNGALLYSPRAYACIVRTLGHTVVPLTTNGAANVYKRVSTMLLQAYINRSSPLAKMLLHNDSSKASDQAGAPMHGLATLLEASTPACSPIVPSQLMRWSEFTTFCSTATSLDGQVRFQKRELPLENNKQP